MTVTHHIPSAAGHPLLELMSVSKSFTGITALSDVSLAVRAGEVTCLLGDNGAGKSTLIKIMSGVHQPSSGRLLVDGKTTVLNSPREAQALGIATVHQDLSTFPLMSVARNFFLGRELTKGRGPIRHLDKRRANDITIERLRAIGIQRVSGGNQLAGTLSGGEQQELAIGRALHFGARLLILDEPTSALGVREAAIVLRLVQRAKEDGAAVVFITHNAHHATTVGDHFTVLIQGAVAAQFARGERSRMELLDLMAGGEALESLQAELEGA
jgi:simple sugar transport system ATP-binding protein